MFLAWSRNYCKTFFTLLHKRWGRCEGFLLVSECATQQLYKLSFCNFTTKTIVDTFAKLEGREYSFLSTLLSAYFLHDSKILRRILLRL